MNTGMISPGAGLADIHCHILPGVDDGAPDLPAALALLQCEYSDGVRTIILTPHYRPGMFEDTEEEVRSAYDVLRKASDERFPDLDLRLGCELHAHMDIVKTLRDRPQCRLAGTDYVLVEFSSHDEQGYIRDRLYELRSSGYEPIIAHVERCKNAVKDMNFAYSLVGMGVKLQVNADSVLGKDGWGMKRICRALMEEDLVHFIGSDAHDMKFRPPRLGECAAWLERKMGENYARRILCENPREILEEGSSYGNK